MPYLQSGKGRKNSVQTLDLNPSTRPATANITAKQHPTTSATRPILAEWVSGPSLTRKLINCLHHVAPNLQEAAERDSSHQEVGQEWELNTLPRSSELGPPLWDPAPDKAPILLPLRVPAEVASRLAALGEHMCSNETLVSVYIIVILTWTLQATLKWCRTWWLWNSGMIQLPASIGGQGTAFINPLSNVGRQQGITELCPRPPWWTSKIHH